MLSETATDAQPQLLTSERHYRHLRWLSVLALSLVAGVPLVVMTVVNYHQYQQAFHVESIRPISRITANAKLSLESFLSERASALSFVSRSETLEQLGDAAHLSRLLTHLQRSFGGFIDIGLIDRKGQQVAYAGPYNLEGKNYAEQDWFHRLHQHHLHISDVFLGFRHLPHFVIAVSHDEDGELYVLRATIDTGQIVSRIRSFAGQPFNDAFLVNRQGVLQTPSRRYGKVLQRIPLPLPAETTAPKVVETKDENGQRMVMGYAYLGNSPFVLMLLHQQAALQGGWLSLRRNLLLFMALSLLAIFAVAFFGATYMVNRTRQSDVRRAAFYHNMEYTNKMAAIGRLAAGVAHEINNPLAVMSQKAGLLKDLLSFSDEMPPKERMLSLIDSVLNSVDRCGNITHRLLGFARHMDVRLEDIDLELLIKEVLTFLEKEASYRNITVTFDLEEDLPTIQSDRGQLQQVFLNIINNAFAAESKGGTIEIAIRRVDQDHVAVAVSDSGIGIAKEDMEHIFEPFFTTKKGTGTGLGLSITYGIVQKLRGKVEVESQIGKGTTFTVTLPLVRRD